MKEITILNAAGGLLVGGICNKFEEGVGVSSKNNKQWKCV